MLKTYQNKKDKEILKRVRGMKLNIENFSGNSKEIFIK